MSSEVTLQINLSPGDVETAERMVPHLVQAHQLDFAEKLVVVDVSRPQRTPIVDPEVRFPVETFNSRADQIIDIAASFISQDIVDRIVILDEASTLRKTISRKYLRGLTQATHDYGGCALMAYLAAFELAETPYLLHYDADMFLHQAKGYDWVDEALSVLESQKNCAAVTPRLAPPDRTLTTRPTCYDWPVTESVEGGWRDYWFSTRVFFFRREALMDHLPLMQGQRYFRALLRKYLRRGFPVSPEVMISARMKQIDRYHFQLSNENAWVLHPREKSSDFKKYLPQIITRVESGDIPDGQRGYPDLHPDYSVWGVGERS